MRTTMNLLVAALLLLHAPLVSAQSARGTSARPVSQSGSEDESVIALPSRPVGTWRSAADSIPLASAFDESVWGKGASSVRTSELTVPASGPATLTVTRKVVDAKGRTVAGSTSIERATVEIGAAKVEGPRAPYDVRVLDAERRYPDPPVSEWKLEGLSVGLARRAGDGDQALELRFDTPEGKGSFWDMLRRVAPGRASR